MLAVQPLSDCARSLAKLPLAARLPTGCTTPLQLQAGEARRSSLPGPGFRILLSLLLKHEHVARRMLCISGTLDLGGQRHLDTPGCKEP